MTPDVNGGDGDIVVPDAITEEAMEEAEGKEKGRISSIDGEFCCRRSEVGGNVSIRC